MAEHFITSTSLRGLRALGLQGDRVSSAYAQITSLLRGRLGPAHAALFAEPQPGRDDLVDWYAPVEGPVTPLVLLGGEEREAAEDRLGTLVADIEGLAAALVDSGRDEEVLLGRMLRLATHLPSADRIYLVGDQPVAVCWGFVEESAADDAPSPLYAFIRTVEPLPGPATPQQPVPPALPAAAAPARRRGSGWQWILLLAGLFVAVILAAWLLRDLGREPVAAVVPDPQPDPAAAAAAEAADARREALFDAISRARDLRVWLAGLEHQLAERKAACEPEELIVPAAALDDEDASAGDPAPGPAVVPLEPDEPEETGPPEEPEEPEEPEGDAGAVDDAVPGAPDEEEAPAEPAADEEAPDEEAPDEEALVIPEDTEGDDALAFLDGCWHSITDLVNQDDVPLDMRYCFGTDGAGEVRVEEESGAECAGPVRATISPNQDLIIATDDDVACDNGETYSSWRIECNRGEGGVADCAGAHSEGGEFEVSIRR